MRRVTLLVVVLLVSAGCLGTGADTVQSPTPTVVDTPTPVDDTETEPGKTSSPSSEATTVTETDEPVGTAGLTHDTGVQNLGSRSVTVTLSVVQNVTGESLLNTTVTLGTYESRRYDVQFPDTGNYTLRASLDGTTRTTSWTLDRRDPSYAVVVLVDDGTVSFSGRAS